MVIERIRGALIKGKALELGNLVNQALQEGLSASLLRTVAYAMVSS